MQLTLKPSALLSWRIDTSWPPAGHGWACIAQLSALAPQCSEDLEGQAVMEINASDAL